MKIMGVVNGRVYFDASQIQGRLSIGHFASRVSVLKLAQALGYTVPQAPYEWILVRQSWPQWLQKMLYVATRQSKKRGRDRQCWEYYCLERKPPNARGRTRKEVQEALRSTIEEAFQVPQDERAGVQRLAGSPLPAAQSARMVGGVQEAGGDRQGQAQGRGTHHRSTDRDHSDATRRGAVRRRSR